MNKSDLAEPLAGRTGMSKVAAKDAVDGVFETIGDALAIGEEARILGFGRFAIRNRLGRTARDPRTGENVTVAASTVPVFKAGKPLKDAVNSRSTA
ncbi:MAG: HU family DNA-binding protein [Rhodospirillales bacterium]|nr:HU family DNA-binding protein [Rhodospirillales bacterium]